MVPYGEVENVIVKQGMVILVLLFAAQINDVIPVLVVQVQESLHFLLTIPVDRLNSSGGKAHRDDLGRNVGQV